MRTDTGALVEALKILSEEIQSLDGVANAAILEGAHRLEELSEELEAVKTENERFKKMMPTVYALKSDQEKYENKIKADAIRSITEQGLEFSIQRGPFDTEQVIYLDDITKYANSLINKEG